VSYLEASRRADEHKPGSPKGRSGNCNENCGGFIRLLCDRRSFLFPPGDKLIFTYFFLTTKQIKGTVSPLTFSCLPTFFRETSSSQVVEAEEHPGTGSVYTVAPEPQREIHRKTLQTVYTQIFLRLTMTIPINSFAALDCD
jgi:hypothetical protein